MRSYLKRYPIVGIIFLILSPIAVVYSISFLCAKSGFLNGLSIPPQDCEMTKAILKGHATDTQGNPIPNAEIYFENTPVDNSTPVKHRILANESGNFGPEAISFFKCEPINFTFNATGFREKTASYILDYGLLNSLPNELTIKLERSS
jgi:hypothetical protein